jgi:hypothetical protein
MSSQSIRDLRSSEPPRPKSDPIDMSHLLWVMWVRSRAAAAFFRMKSSDQAGGRPEEHPHVRCCRQ